MPSLPSPPSWIAAESSIDHPPNTTMAMVHSQVSPSLQRVVGLIVPLLVAKATCHIIESFTAQHPSWRMPMMGKKRRHSWASEITESAPLDDQLSVVIYSMRAITSYCDQRAPPSYSTSSCVVSGTAGVLRWVLGVSGVIPLAPERSCLPEVL